MVRVLPPPPERFEPVTARWLVPGGPLHDPERDAVDPAHNEPITLVGAPPRELAEASLDDPTQISRARRRRRLVALAFVLVAIAAIIIGGGVIGF